MTDLLEGLLELLGIGLVIVCGALAKEWSKHLLDINVLALRGGFLLAHVGCVREKKKGRGFKRREGGEEGRSKGERKQRSKQGGGLDECDRNVLHAVGHVLCCWLCDRSKQTKKTKGRKKKKKPREEQEEGSKNNKRTCAERERAKTHMQPNTCFLFVVFVLVSWKLERGVGCDACLASSKKNSVRGAGKKSQALLAFV